MKFLLTLLVTSLSIFSVGAADQLPLIQPKDSGLTLTPVKFSYIAAQFSGQVPVQGTLVAQWVVGVDEQADNTRQFFLVPHPKAAASLPFFKGYPVRKIELVNGAAALRMIGGEKLANDFQAKRVKTIQSEGSFVIDNYLVGVECDAQWAKASIVRINPTGLVTSSNSTQSFGC